MRDGAPSTVARFTDTAVSLFPQMKADPEEALSVSQAMVMLHRRMERALRRAESAAAPAEDGAGGTPPTPTRGWRFRR